MDRLLQFVLSNAVAAMALAFVAAGASRIIGRPAETRALWVLVLRKLFTPPVWTVPGSFPVAAAPSVVESATSSRPVASETVEQYTIADQPAEPDSEVVDAPEPEPVRAPAAPVENPNFVAARFSWATLVLTLWLCGAVTVLLLIFRSTLGLRRLVRSSVPAPMAIRRRATHLGRRMGLGVSPQILLARGTLPPMLCATGFRARVILPASLWAQLDEAQQDTVLVHELAHLRHGDHWVRRLELLAAVFYWWHPAVWWSRPRLRESSEQCCDAWVVWALPRLARSYAEALVETVDFISLSRPALPVLASGMGQFTDLKRRLVMINQASAPRSLSRTGYTAVCSLAGLLLPLAPSFAQEAAPVAPVPPAPPAEVQRPALEVAPDAPKPEAAPKANFLVAPDPFGYSVEEDGASRNANVDMGRGQIERARAQVEKLRAQLREAERRLGDMERSYGRMEADRARAEAQKEREKARAEAQKERAKAMAEAQKERAKAAQDRAGRKDGKGGYDAGGMKPQGDVDVLARPKPKIETNFQYRVEPRRSEEYQRAGARIKAAGGAGDNADLERRLNQMEKQLDQLVGQLHQMRQQVGRPGSGSEGGMQKK